MSDETWKEYRMKKQPIDKVKSSFVGAPYSLCVAHEIESQGYGFTVSCETGTIVNVFEPSIGQH